MAEGLEPLQDAAHLPVGTTVMGKGSVDETHPLSLGVVGYSMGKRASSRAYKSMLKRADVVIHDRLVSPRLLKQARGDADHRLLHDAHIEELARPLPPEVVEERVAVFRSHEK